MTDTPLTAPYPGASEADDPTARRAHRRRWMLLGFSVAAVIAISVVTDLPTHQTPASEASGARAFLNEVNSDLTPCAFATSESFRLLADLGSASLSAANRGRIPSLLRDDQSACSFTNQSIFDLSSLEPPGGPAGKQLGNVVSAALLWTTSDALGAIIDVARLDQKPGDAAATKDLALRYRELGVDRQHAIAAWRAVSVDVHQAMPALDLPVVTLPG